LSDSEGFELLREFASRQTSSAMQTPLLLQMLLLQPHPPMLLP